MRVAPQEQMASSCTRNVLVPLVRDVDRPATGGYMIEGRSLSAGTRRAGYARWEQMASVSRHLATSVVTGLMPDARHGHVTPCVNPREPQAVERHHH